ncbi:hypothetical protein DXG03_004928 [Asterophora parasitica]|uniref:NAD(P)-binding protein n=1 Tax=Asterophora parasitica TaxID=117018 RepID=A0A9P7KDS5_9AGAR|nr:hypothetical protein DXG03_004928 [Asterophora parasitica]
MGITSSIPTIWSQAFPPASAFSVDDIPDLTGKVAIVTGSNTGIGKETVKHLLVHNAKVYLAARSPEKAKEAIEDLRVQTGKEALFLKLDLADLKSIKAAATEFQEGVMKPPVDALTADGYDLQMGVNVLGHFYFTKLLLPTLTSTAHNSPEKHVRVLTTSSVMHYFGALDFNTFKDGPARRRTRKVTLYNQSKYGNLVFAKELGRRYGDQGIVSIAVNPGNIVSDLQRNLVFPESLTTRWILYPTPMGALTQLWGATSKEGAGFNGKALHQLPARPPPSSASAASRH